MDYLRVRGFGVNLQRVRTFGHALANKTEGFAFCADPGQNLERARTFGKGLQRVRTFGHGLTNYSEGCALLDISSKGFALFSIFRLRCEGLVVFEFKWHQTKTSKIKRPFLLHSVFIKS